VQITLLERAPFDGPLLIDVDGEHHALAHDMAKLLIVSPWEETESA
jgi:Fe2+ transport system protein FeoA